MGHNPVVYVLRQTKVLLQPRLDVLMSSLGLDVIALTSARSVSSALPWLYLLIMNVRATFSRTYSTVVALWPRSSRVTPPALSVRERLRELELWAPCRLRGSPKTGLRLVRQRSQQLRELVTNVCLHYSYTPAPANVSNTRSIVFGCLNIWSLIKKFDDVTELFRDHHINLLCLTKSWCDSDSAVLGRLRNAAYNVADRPRPRCASEDKLSVNHGGIVSYVIARARSFSLMASINRIIRITD